MDDKMIFEGTTYQEAVDKAISKLKVEEKEMLIKIIGEKKSSLFRKSHVKIKVNFKDVQDESKGKTVVDLKQMRLNEVSFAIDFRPDGVYLTMSESIAQTKAEQVKKIFEYIEKKKIQKVDFNLIEGIVNDKPGNAVKIASEQSEKMIDSEIKVKVSDDRLTGKLMITKPYGGKTPSMEAIKEALRKKGIINFVDEKVIVDVIAKKKFDDEFIISNGKKPVHGIDGTFTLKFSSSKEFLPKIMDDGTVDFKELDQVKNVKKGQLLAEITRPTEGEKGVDVLGREIDAKKGKEAKLIKGKNTMESQDGLSLFADMDGQVSIIDNKLSVSTVYEVPGDVDTTTGNIKFNGKVFVKGNVKSGFTVEAESDIEVLGVVEGATLIAKGHIILHRGVQGNNQAYLEAGGSLIAKYIENTTIKAAGDVEADCILHSNVSTKNKVKLTGRKGLIAGGDIRAGVDIRAHSIGSPMGTSTIIEVGVDPDEKENYEKLKLEVEDVEKNVKKLDQSIRLLGKMAKASQLPKNKQQVLIKSVSTYEQLKETHTSLTKDLKLLEYNIQNQNKGKISALNKIHPGVKMTIGSGIRQIYDEISNTTLSIKEGSIIIGPYEK
ncbi:protein of unknown function DUF342 [Alkaliphilus metalliredigens QYMF]|uniref:RNA-binding protein KhpB N-terminal domain-containing protein n=1 Tax=Alkaliphilus metalliredigens (strain QYMF) TaxID=293826 RepID=A6TRM7_ALKMQ|nr:FapA family protein [Alkaliphilus metalliredigens]ABR48845.1 protein of unknown function DUF342 [Alkaliphilus metalliredigens QYMF]